MTAPKMNRSRMGRISHRCRSIPGLSCMVSSGGEDAGVGVRTQCTHRITALRHIQVRLWHCTRRFPLDANQVRCVKPASVVPSGAPIMRMAILLDSFTTIFTFFLPASLNCVLSEDLSQNRHFVRVCLGSIFFIFHPCFLLHGCSRSIRR